MQFYNKTLTLLFLVAFLFTTLPAFAQDKNTSVSISQSSHNGKTKLEFNNGLDKYKIEYEGKIVPSEDDTDIIGITEGGYIEISKSVFGNRRRIFIEANRSGQLIKQYYVGRTKQSYDPEGRAWMAEILPEIVRSTTLGAETRVDRFYSKGGANGVLNEIRRMSSDYVATAYLKLLLKKNLNSTELVQLLDVAADKVDSDYYLADLLQDNQRAFLATDNTTAAYINACKKIDSDHYQHEVLKTAIRDGNISDAQMTSLLQVTQSIGSDHYQSEVLKEIMDRRTLNADNLATLLRLTSNIDSDHYHSEVLKKALRSDNLSNEAFEALLNGIRNIQSDHYSREVIRELADKKMSESTLRSLLDIMKSVINSDHYMHEALKDIARHQKLEGSVLDAYMDCVASIGSAHYGSQVIRDLADIPNLSESQLIKIIQMTRRLSSDHYLAEALVSLADKTRAAGENAKNAYREAARSIRSETYYGRAMRALE